MKKWQKWLTTFVVVLTFGALSVTAFAASNYTTPAEVAAGVTGRTLESVTEERAETGNRYGTIASQADKLDAFKAEMLELRKEQLAERVAAGTMTQERADEILAAIEANQAVCDGTGNAGLCAGTGMGCGIGGGVGHGCGTGRGMRGTGHGMRANTGN